MIWKLNKIQYPIYNLGPGKRIGIWVQGCSIHCQNCINKSLWDKNNGKAIDLLSVFHVIEKLAIDFDGITITGGEPFDQYPQLMAFASLVKKKTNLDIICYTGYYLKELREKFEDQSFLQCLDYIVDGRYEPEKKTTDLMKGSANQTVYKFIDNKAFKSDLKNERKIWSLNLVSETVHMAGIPRANEMENLSKDLENKNIHVEIC